ncbi:hypothetical protein [Amycolatopsis sp. NPDC058986]|uniref:hypothetical protein n=1 Tax=unclassified Amycolatopsis TaxID=2618356 RepID=UPI00366B1932
MRRFLLSGLVLLLAGCGATAARTPAPPPVPPSPTPSPSSAAPPPAKSLTDLRPADAELAPFDLRLFGDPVPYLASENTTLALVAACGEKQPWDAKAKQGTQVEWTSDRSKAKTHAKQLIVRYEGTSGAAVVNGVKQALRCGTVQTEGMSVQVGGEVGLPSLGLDAQYAFCDQFPSGDIGRCYLLLAKGDKASVVVMAGNDRSAHPERQTLIPKIAPIFAAALSRP